MRLFYSTSSDIKNWPLNRERFIAENFLRGLSCCLFPIAACKESNITIRTVSGDGWHTGKGSGDERSWSQLWDAASGKLGQWIFAPDISISEQSEILKQINERDHALS